MAKTSAKAAATAAKLPADDSAAAPGSPSLQHQASTAEGGDGGAPDKEKALADSGEGAATAQAAAAEAAAADVAAIAEALTPPGASVADVLSVWGRPTHIEVRAAHDGFRRCGRAWSVEAQRVPLEDLDEDAIERLLNDPNLVAKLVSDRE